MRHRTATNLLIILSTLCYIHLQWWHIFLQTKDHACPIFFRFHCENNSFVVFLIEPTGLEQRYSSPAIFAGNGTCPEIGNCWFAIYCWIEALQIGFCLLEYPPAPRTDMPCKI